VACDSGKLTSQFLPHAISDKHIMVSPFFFLCNRAIYRSLPPKKPPLQYPDHLRYAPDYCDDDWVQLMVTQYRTDVAGSSSRDDELDAGVEDDALLHCGMHAILATAGVTSTFPEACEEGLSALHDFLRKAISIISLVQSVDLPSNCCHLSMFLPRKKNLEKKFPHTTFSGF